MGAESIINVHYGDLTMQQAYRARVEEALHDHGHGGYSGTISESRGVFLASGMRADQPIREDEAEKIAEKRLDDYTEVKKWGPAAAIPILKVIPARHASLGYHTTTVTVDSDKLNDQDYMKAEVAKALNRQITKGITKLDGHEGVTVPKRLTAKNIGTTYTKGDPEHTGKSTTTRTEGKTVTRYFIVNIEDPKFPKWEDGHATQSEARKNLPKSISTHAYASNAPKAQKFGIFPMTAREDGSPVVEHEVVPEKTTVKVDAYVEVETSRAKVTKERGWLFFAVVSS